MRLWLAAALVFATLVVDSSAVSSLGISASEQPIRIRATVAHPTPLILLVTNDGKSVGGVALAAQ